MQLAGESILVALALAGGAAILAPARAGDGPTQPSAQTGFDPRKHGFGFTNYFEGDVLVDIPLIGNVDLGDSTYGLCGGMSCAALDTFAAGGAAPPGDDPPASGTQLRSYLYGRQMDTFKQHDAFLVVRLVAWSWRPIESSWLWTGLYELSQGQFHDVVAPSIEAGRPATLCVIRSDIHDYTPADALSEDGFLENHQVLAIGFRSCAATSGAGAHWGIDVYDPNQPGIVCTMHLLPDGGILTAKTRTGGSPVSSPDDPTKNALGDFRGFFATNCAPQAPFWVDSPAPSLRDVIAKMGQDAVAFGDDDAASPSGKKRAPGAPLADLIASSSARVDALRAEVAALEVRIAALESGGGKPVAGGARKGQ